MNPALWGRGARIALFAVVAGCFVLLGVAVLLLGSRGTEQAGTGPRSAPTATAAANDPARPQGEPSDGGTPVGPASDVVATVTRANLTKYLTAAYTYTWQESSTVYRDRVIAAGAVPGSTAARHFLKGSALDQCMRQHCSGEFVRVVDFSVEKDLRVLARIEVRSVRDGRSTTEVLNCSLAVATGPQVEDGVFVGGACPGGDG